VCVCAYVLQGLLEFAAISERLAIETWRHYRMKKLAQQAALLKAAERDVQLQRIPTESTDPVETGDPMGVDSAEGPSKAYLL